MNYEWNADEERLRSELREALTPFAVEGARALDPEAKERSLRAALGAASATSRYSRLGQGHAATSSAVELLAAQEVVAEISRDLFMGLEGTLRLFGGLAADAGRIPLLEKVRAGTTLGAVVLPTSDKTHAVRAPRPSISAVRAGESWTLSGRAEHVLNAPFADHFALVAGAEGGLVVAFLARGAPGLSLGGPTSTAAYSSSAFGFVECRSVEVGWREVSGTHQAEASASWAQRAFNLQLAVASTEVARATHAAATSYAKATRRQGRPLVHSQEIGFPLAESLTSLHAAQLMVRRAAWAIATHDLEATLLVHAAKVFSADTARQISTLAQEIYGLESFALDAPAQVAARDASYGALAGTDVVAARLEIATTLLSPFQKK
jgi:alkylation response protein AidB-like acyl-CoA dehydrogenase